MSYETDLAQAEVGAVLRDVIIDLLRQSHAHLHDISFSMLLIGAGAQEHGLWEQKSDIVLEEAHVV